MVILDAKDFCTAVVLFMFIFLGIMSTLIQHKLSKKE